MAEAVFQEVSVPGYPGAGFFKRMEKERRFRIIGADSRGKAIEGLTHLDRGELETLSLFLGCRNSSTFIIMDDGKGARYCYSQGIPFINALLVPKIFWYAGRMDTETYTDKTGRLIEAGRYSKTIIKKAETLTREDLALFIPDESTP